MHPKEYLSSPDYIAVNVPKNKRKNFKAPKSFKELKNIPTKELFSRGKLKKIPAKQAIQIARLLVDDFDKIDLRKKKISAKDSRRARLAIQDFHDATRGAPTKIFTPSKRNREKYADAAELSPKFKHYPLPIFSPEDKYTVTKDGNLKRKGRFIDSELFKFPDIKKFARQPEAETDALVRKINKKVGRKTRRSYKVQVGRHVTNAEYLDQEILGEELGRWVNEYGREKVKQFVKGLVVYTFSNQEARLPSKLKKKIEKKEATAKKIKRKKPKYK